MIPVRDASGNKVKGLYKLADGSLVVKDDVGLNKHIKQKNAMESMSNEIKDLKIQMAQLLEIVNGKH